MCRNIPWYKTKSCALCQSHAQCQILPNSTISLTLTSGSCVDDPHDLNRSNSYYLSVWCQLSYSLPVCTRTSYHIPPLCAQETGYVMILLIYLISIHTTRWIRVEGIQIPINGVKRYVCSTIDITRREIPCAWEHVHEKKKNHPPLVPPLSIVMYPNTTRKSTSYPTILPLISSSFWMYVS